MSARLTRQEIKRDEVLETVGSAVSFIRGHLRLLLLGLAAVAVLALAWAVIAAFQTRREGAAQEALAAALEIYAAPLDPAAPAPDDPESPTFADDASRRERAQRAFAEVRESYGGTDAADVASAYLGELAAAAGELDAARAHWESFLGGQKDHALALGVRLNLMELDRLQERSEELAERLRALADEEDGPLPREVVLDQLGRTLEAMGRPSEAAEVYRRLVEEHPGSPYQARAQRQADALEAEATGT